MAALSLYLMIKGTIAVHTNFYALNKTKHTNEDI